MQILKVLFRTVTLLHRAFCICSSWPLFHIEIEKLRLNLHRNGYCRNFIDKCIERFLNSVVVPKTRLKVDEPKTVTIVLPYLGKLSLDVRARLLKLFKFAYPSLRCRVVFRTVSRVSNYFPFKDRFPLSLTSSCVYKFICGNCNITYIGKTSRHF